jgi:hypothetical protein
MNIKKSRGRAGGMLQAIEYLPSKWKVLNSSPNTTRKKKKRQEIWQATILRYKYLVTLMQLCLKLIWENMIFTISKEQYTRLWAKDNSIQIYITLT